MRGLKVKTMRRVAREAGLPTERDYRAKIHSVNVLNPEWVKGGSLDNKFISVKRVQCLLGRCQKRMVKILKARCPKNSFFGMSIGYYRSGGIPEGLRNATITVLDGPPQ